MLRMAAMRVGLITVYSHRACTLKDVAGGFGTAFHVGSSVPARLLQRAKSRLAHLPPTTLGYLAAQLEADGHQVVVAELRRRDAGRDDVPACDVAIVSSSMVDAGAERDVLKELAVRGIRTVVIGAHASHLPEGYADVADVVVRGEAEAMGRSLLDPGLVGLVDAGTVADIDGLPWPSWQAFPIATYRYGLLAPRGVTLPVAGVRGCAFGCAYCPFRVTAAFRQRDPNRVAAEVAHLKQRYGARGISFRDPIFNFDRDRTLALADALAPLDVRFSAEMRADLLDEEMLLKLHRGGLRSLEIGVESIDTTMLRREHRSPPSIAEIEATVATAHRLGIRVIANFILGLPDDTAETMAASIAWAKRLNPFAVQFTVATPYPGTSLSRRVSPTRHTFDAEAHTGWEPLFHHPNLTAGQLRGLREWAYVSYHFRPAYVGRFARQALSAVFD